MFSELLNRVWSATKFVFCARRTPPPPKKKKSILKDLETWKSGQKG